MHRQLAQGLCLRDIALFEIFPTQITHAQGEKRAVLNRQVPAQFGGSFGERSCLVKLPWLDIKPRQDGDGVKGGWMFLAEKFPAQLHRERLAALGERTVTRRRAHERTHEDHAERWILHSAFTM